MSTDCDPRLTCTTKWNALTVVTRASWGRTTPLGTPVEPEVYMMMAGSMVAGGTAERLDLPPSSHTSLKPCRVTPSCSKDGPLSLKPTGLNF